MPSSACKKKDIPIRSEEHTAELHQHDKAVFTMRDDCVRQLYCGVWHCHRRSERFGVVFFFFFNNPAPPEIYPLPLPDALPILAKINPPPDPVDEVVFGNAGTPADAA